MRDYLSLLHVRSFCVPRLGALHLLPEDVVAEADVTAESRGHESSHSSCAADACSKSIGATGIA